MRAGGISSIDGVDRWAQLADRGIVARSRGTRACRIRPRHRQRAARCRRGCRLALSRRRDAARRSADPRGLRIASLDMFASGAILRRCARSVPGRCGQCSRNCRSPRSSAAFRSSDANPLVGLEGRADLLRRLGRHGRERAKDIFGMHDTPRPGGLFDHHRRAGNERRHRRARDPAEVLLQLGPIWPSRLDARRHSARRLLATSGDQGG